ncbi:hypothetical protein AB0C13_33895 [Streptomyces sp. NPDC049099]|uniref:hypothetical protein n=1 Tax=Streptomyces sp. NPDC049099 TaxID=3155768 RepID=UPI0034458FCE
MAEEGDREVELVAGLLDLLAGERAAAGQGAQTALDVQGGEEFQELAVLGVADGRQFLGEPPLEQQQLTVGRRQDAALPEQIAQVGDRPPGRELAQPSWDEGHLAASQSPQVPLWAPPVAGSQSSSSTYVASLARCGP